MLTMLVANLRETRTNTQTAELVRKHKAPTVLLRTKWVCVFVGVAVSLRALTAKISRVLFVRVLKKLRTESNWKRYTEGEGGRQAVCHFNEHFSLPAKSTESLPLFPTDSDWRALSPWDWCERQRSFGDVSLPPSSSSSSTTTSVVAVAAAAVFDALVFIMIDV